MHLIEDYILYSFLCVKLQDATIPILNLNLTEALPLNVFSQCVVWPLPKGAILLLLYNGQDFLFGFIISPILRLLQTLIEV